MPNVVEKGEQMSAILQHRAATLAEDGMFECKRCRRIRALENGIVVAFQGNFLLGLCVECFESRPIVIRVVDKSSVGKAVEVRMLSDNETRALEGSTGLYIAAPALSVGVRSIKAPEAIKPIVKTVIEGEG